jgi:hypothetical protein
MAKDERDMLEVLKAELEFLEKGGYGRPPREPWRPACIFEDSPSCVNHEAKQDGAQHELAPCTDCILIDLVPAESRSEKIPCRHIQLTASGETLDSLYRYGDEYEIEETVRNWLRKSIYRLEREREPKRANEATSAAKTSS